MSQVHCLECGGKVVVDPRGQCPDGHTVGTPGNRIEMAMGHETAHPDEPQPWVYRIDPAEVDGEAKQGAARARLSVANGATDGTTNGSGPARPARPVRAPGMPEEDDEPADAESLLRELHSLAALDTALTHRTDDGTGDAHRREGPPAVPTTPPPPPSQAAAPAPRPPRGDPEQIADAFAELSALDVPTGTTNGHRPKGVTPTPPPVSDAAGATAGATPPSPPRRVSPADGGGAVDELASLFGNGPLFAQDDPPAPATDVADGAGIQRPAPSTPAAPTEAVGAGGVPPTDEGDAGNEGDEGDAGLELEAIFQSAEPPPVASETRRVTPSASSGHRPSSQPDAADDVPPAVPLRRRRTAAPAAPAAPTEPSEDAADSQPVHAAVGSAQVLDLSSFTAKGGPGAGRSTGRRRRFGR